MENQAKSGAAPGFSIANLLSKDLIRVRLPQRDKQGLMKYLVQDLCTAKSLADSQQLLDVILKREVGGITTTLDSGLSLPHARIDGLAETTAILGLPSEPIPDPTQSEFPIRAMFLFFSPNRQEVYSQQLLLLRSIAMLFQNNFLDELLRATSPEQVLKLILDRETSIRKS